MIPYDVDPSLHSTQPKEPVLDDGFSRPDGDGEHVMPQPAPAPVLPDKSDF